MVLKQGDTVVIKDWSYVTLIKPNGVLDGYSRDGLFTVVATNVGNLPVTDYCGKGGVKAYDNDTIIFHNETKEVLFCHAELLGKVCPKCGHWMGSK